MKPLFRRRGALSVSGAAVVLAAVLATAVPAQAYKEYEVGPPSEALLCYAEASSALGVVENFLSPASGSMVAAATPITFSSDSSQPLSFAIASSEALLSTPNVDGGPGSPGPPPPNAAGTQHYSFTSTKATATAGTVYWQASFSTAAMPHCADYVRTEKTAVRTLTVLSPSFSEAEADAKKKQEEEAAAKKHGEEEVAMAARVNSALIAALVPHGSAAKLGAITKAGGYVVAFAAPTSGSVTIAWYEVPKGAHVSSAKPVLVATGTAKVGAAGNVKVPVRLTAKGKQLLRHARSQKLTAKATFTPTGKTESTAIGTFALRR
jgi:hypothetical protein